MSLHNSLLSLLVLTLSTKVARALDNGVAKLPVMGYNTWNAFACNIDQDLLINQATVMKDLGLLDAGYSQVNLDDCWAELNRSSTGQLVADTTRFSRGMKNLTGSLNALGFTAGIYGDSGWKTCAGYPGSYTHEVQDVETYTEWGFNYLKLDNCYIPFDDVIRQGIIGKYERMSSAIMNVSATTGEKPMIFSLCEWGWSQVWLWGAQLGHSWRIDGDIEPYWSSITSIINQVSFITQGTNFYGRNDMDMLQLGNGNLTYDESKTHWTAWALIKSPLLIGANLSAVEPEIIDILKNEEIIAINQDDVVGTSISPFRWGTNPDFTWNASFPAQYWSGPTKNGTVFMLINTADEPADMFFQLIESPWIRAGREYAVRDLWAHTDNGTAIRNYTAMAVPAHGVAALLMTDAGNEPDGLMPPCAVDTQCSYPNGTEVNF